MSKFKATATALAAAVAVSLGGGVAAAPPASAASVTRSYVCSVLQYDQWSQHLTGVSGLIKVTTNGTSKTVTAGWSNYRLDYRSRNVVLAVTSKLNGANKALLGNQVVIGTTKTGATMNVSLAVAWLDLATKRTNTTTTFCLTA